jgi:hypothetical protein
MSYRTRIAVTLTAATLALTGCADAESGSAEGDPAATVEEVAGSDVKKVVLSDVGAQRLQLATEPVQVGDGGAGLAVPYDAIVYDENGDTWVFTSPEDNTFVRAQVVIAGIDGDTATLSSGPLPGTQVVTVGTAELIGAEAGLGA